MELIAQQSTPKLWLSLTALAIVYAFLAWRVLGGIRRRAARRRVKRTDAAVVGTRTSPLKWVVFISLAIALFIFLQMRQRPTASVAQPVERSWAPITIGGGTFVVMMSAVGLLALRVHLANRVVREAIRLKSAGDLPAALALLRRERSACDPRKNPTRYAAMTVGLSNLLAESGDLSAAESLLRDAATHYPSDGTWSMAIAMIVARAGRHEDALALLEAGRQQSPREVAIRLCAATQLVELGRFAEAAERLRQAEELFGAYPAEQRTPAKTLRETIAGLRGRVGESTRAFDVIVPADRPPT